MTTVEQPVDVLLSDGTTVQLRQIRPEDAPEIVAMHGRFSERTRYLRYFSPYPRIPERDLKRFVNVDHRDREAFVVLAGERIVAVGRYERLGPASPEAEVAFVVEDAYQGRGIGSVLLEHLADAAGRNGIVHFVAEVLPANGAMLRVFADFGYQVQRQYADGVVHLTFPIAPTEATLEVQRGREHRTEARSIARLLAPRGIAVYGASTTGQGVGAALLGHLRDGGFTGAIVPVHPSAATVAGLPAYPSAADAGQDVDLAVVAVPPDAVTDVVRDAARAGAHGLVVISAGFAESGPAGAAAQRALVRAAHLAGMRVVGPNCLGVANTDPAVRLNATLAPVLPAAGRVGVFSQSGAFGVALLAEASRRGLGLSSFVSAGNRADVSGNDLLQYWQDDPATDVITLYLETFGNPRKFARLARRIGRSKPVVALASLARPPGVGEAPALDAAAVSALFAQSGVIRVDTVSELLDVGVLLAHQPLPAGRRVAVVGNSSALTGLAATACAAQGLTVADGYPRDVGPSAGAAAYAAALGDAVADERVDAVVAVFAPPLPGQLADPVADFASALPDARVTGKPVVATFLAGLVPAGVPAYPSVEEAVRALGRVTAYADWLRRPAGVLPELPDVDRTAGHAALRPDGADAAALLRAYGIDVVESVPATTTESAGRRRAARLAGGAQGCRPRAAAPPRPRRGTPRPGRRRRAAPRVRRDGTGVRRGGPGPADGRARRGVRGGAGGGSGVRAGGRVRARWRGDRTARRPGLAGGAADRPGRRRTGRRAPGRAAPARAPGRRAGGPGGAGRPAGAGRAARRRAAPGAVAHAESGAGPAGRHLGAARHRAHRRGGGAPRHRPPPLV
ncbi:LOW QUALITY PROTEIN: acetyltransferase, GNAT family, partial [Micromonospora sp. M42]